jgi:hypothetical protein
MLKPETSTVPHLLRYYLPADQLLGFRDALFHYIRAARRHFIVELYEATDPHQLFMGDVGLAGNPNDSPLFFFKQMCAELNRKASSMRKSTLISRLRKAALQDAFFDVARPEAGTYRFLSFLVDNGADLVVHGHTHSAKAYKVSARFNGGTREGLYLNSGTWAQLLRLPSHDDNDETWKDFVEDLSRRKAQGPAKGFARPTFAHIRLEGGRTVAQINEWKDGIPLQLAAYIYSSENLKWMEKE